MSWVEAKGLGGYNFPLQGRQGSRGCIPGSPGESGLVSTVHGIIQANTGVGWHLLLQGIFLTQGSSSRLSCIGRRILFTAEPRDNLLIVKKIDAGS